MALSRPSFPANKNLWIGVVGALVIVGLLVGTSAFESMGIGQRSIDVEFVQAAGIRGGDKVKVAGIDVGQVKSVELEGGHVLAVVDVDNTVHLGSDAQATIKMSTLLGARYVELDPGDGTGLPDDRIPVANTNVPYDLADIVQVGTPKFEAIDADKIAESLALLNRQLGDSPALTAQALNSVGALAKVIDTRRAEVDTLLRNLDQVTTVLDDNRNSILSIIAQGEAITDRVVERQVLVTQLLDDVATLTRQLEEIGAQNQDQFGPTIQTLNTMSEGLEKNRENLDHLLEIMPVTARQLNNATGDGPYANLALPWLFPDNWLCLVRVVEGCVP